MKPRWFAPAASRRVLQFAAVALLLACPARAAEDLDKEMGVVAKGIKQLLDGRGQTSIAVGEFTGPSRANSSGGAGIKQALIEQLKQAGVTVGRRAELEVKGDYVDVEDKETKLVALRLKARVIDREGTEVTHFDRGLFNVTTVASLIGLTANLTADAPDKERSEAILDAIDKPKVHLAGTRIAAAADSPYAIEVLVKTGKDYRPRAATKDTDGFATLKIRRDEIYSVKVINDSPYDAAVTLTIDGLSVFAFSSTPSYTHWIVAKQSTLTIPGWHRTNQVSDSFQVMEYSKSAAAEKLPGSTTIGTITASFAAAWPKGSTPPDDEAPAKKGSRSGDGTGKGPPVTTNFQEVVRDVGRLRSSVSVRYNKEVEPKDLPGAR